MFLNYIKIAFRNLFKYKVFSLINISGLAIGMCCCFLILLWVLDELSFDRFHEHYPDLYRTVIDVNDDTGKRTTVYGPSALGPALKEEFPEVVDFARYVQAPQLALKHGDVVFNEKIMWADPGFFRIFTFPAIDGNLDTALNTPTSMVITRRIARKYFGTDRDVIGKVLKLNNRTDFQITAIIDDVPANSHLDFDIIAPFSTLKNVGWQMNSWRRYNSQTYLKLKKNFPYEQFNDKIKKIIEKHQTRFTYSADLFVQPLSRIHLYSDFRGDQARLGNITHIYILSIVAGFTLLIACINFMNLSTARSANRVKEIAVRKVVGAQRTHLIAQFYGESVFLSVVATVVALVLVKLLLPSFNALSGKMLTLTLAGNRQVIAGIVGITFFSGIIAGSYPAFFLSSFEPARALKGSLKIGRRSIGLRKILVVLQFALSVMLIISTAIVHNQLQFIKNKDLGYDKKNVMMIRMNTGRRSEESFETLRNELKKSPKILGVAATLLNPTKMERATMVYQWKGKNPDDRIPIHYNVVTIDYINTLRMRVKEGRGFSEEIISDRNGAALLNEEAVKTMGFKNPIGETVTAGSRKRIIIGVLKNFHFQPIHKKIEPMIVVSTRIRAGGYTMIKLHPDQMSEIIGFIKKTWDKVYPAFPFDYHFLDEDYDRLYRAEERMGILLNYFSVLAIFIACLGLFGLASFTTEQRTKEIGIRKVVGASVLRISMLLCKDFIKLVLVANLFAWPIAYYFMTNWLQDFAYRININWLMFLITGILSVIIALFTVSFQSIKAAMANPVESLRYE